MKIVAVVPGFSRAAGDAVIPALRALLVGLHRRGHDVRVLALRYPPGRRDYTIEGVTVRTLGGQRAVGLGRVALLAEAIDAAVALGRGGAGAFASPCVVVGFWADEPGYVAVHAAARLGVRAHVALMGGELAALDAIGYGVGGQALGPALVDVALARADSVSVGSAWLRDRAAAPGAPYALGRGRAPPTVLPLGLDVAAWRARAGGAPAPARARHAPLRIGCLASLVAVKHQAALLRAIARLRRQGADVTLELAGEGPEAGALLALADALGVRGAATLRGALVFTDVPAWLASLDLHVLPSLWESQGMATLEAGALGVAVGGSAVGALADLDAACVRAAAGDDVGLCEALAAWVEGVAGDPDAIAAAGEAARVEVERRYDLGAVVACWETALACRASHARAELAKS